MPVCSIDSRYSPCSSSTSSISATEESRVPGRPLAPSNDPQHPCVSATASSSSSVLMAATTAKQPKVNFGTPT